MRTVPELLHESTPCISRQSGLVLCESAGQLQPDPWIHETDSRACSKARNWRFGGIAVLMVGLTFAGCSLPPAIPGNGVIVSESRAVEDFHAVSISGSGRARIRQGDSESLEIRADENLLPYIQSEVRNGELKIWTRRGNLRFTERPEYTIELRELDGLRLSGSLQAEMGALRTERLDAGISGSGSIKVGPLEARSVKAGISGSGTVVLDEGKAERLDLSVSGSGNLRAEGLEAGDVRVSISGSGNARVWASRFLDAHVSGSGDIRYKGSPEVSSSVSGSGKIRRIP